jgi:HAD superfamily hydrolase (TIGR01509 family)
LRPWLRLANPIRFADRMRDPKGLDMLKALIFDMDGTLADSDPVHLRAFIEFMAPFGVKVDEDVYRSSISGKSNSLIFANLLPDHSPEDRERFADEKEAAFRRLATELEPLAGLIELLDWADAQGLGLGIVTNAPRANLDHTLAALKIASRFQVLVCAEDVARGKPDPLPYLTALERLGVSASEAVAFEDSVSGIQAAKAAGMPVFGVLTGQPEDVLKRAGAEATLSDFRDAGLWDYLRPRRKPAA